MRTKDPAAVLNVTSVKFPPQLEDFEGWKEPKRIMVLLAHPDDPEFFCGATLIRWAKAGHEIGYCLITKGQRGSKEIDLSLDQIAQIRMREQKNAAEYIGVKSVEFLDELDGELQPSLILRKEIVKRIRNFSPQIIVTSDPQNFYTIENRLNHPDHRAAGEIVLGAAFPAAGNPQIYKSIENESFGQPVEPEEIWISATNQPNLTIDVTPYFEQKVEAISFHVSQIADKAVFSDRMKARFVEDPDSHQKIYIERFRRLIL
jgi:LmbE family N-acetylglucosaminyl deacetylase